MPSQNTNYVHRSYKDIHVLGALNTWLDKGTKKGVLEKLARTLKKDLEVSPVIEYGERECFGFFNFSPPIDAIVSAGREGELAILTHGLDYQKQQELIDRSFQDLGSSIPPTMRLIFSVEGSINHFTKVYRAVKKMSIAEDLDFEKLLGYFMYKPFLIAYMGVTTAQANKQSADRFDIPQDLFP